MRRSEHGIVLIDANDEVREHGPDRETGLTELAASLDIPYPSVHREVERAKSAGLLVTRRVGRARLVSVNSASPYYDGLRQVLRRACGPPTILAEAIAGVEGIEAAYLFGSWAPRPLEDPAAAGVFSRLGIDHSASEPP